MYYNFCPQLLQNLSSVPTLPPQDGQNAVVANFCPQPLQNLSVSPTDAPQDVQCLP